MGSGRSHRSHETDLRRTAGKTWIQICGPTSVCATLGFSDILKCNPESTNWMVRLVLIVATAAFTSFGTTSPPGQSIRSLTRGCCGCSSPGTRAVHHEAGHVLAVPRIAPAYYLVVAATTYLSPKRGLEATCQAQKGALSRVLHGSELHHRAERAKKRFP